MPVLAFGDAGLGDVHGFTSLKLNTTNKPKRASREDVSWAYGVLACVVACVTPYKLDYFSATYCCFLLLVLSDKVMRSRPNSRNGFISRSWKYFLFVIPINSIIFQDDFGELSNISSDWHHHGGLFLGASPHDAFSTPKFLFLKVAYSRQFP